MSIGATAVRFAIFCAHLRLLGCDRNRITASTAATLNGLIAAIVTISVHVFAAMIVIGRRGHWLITTTTIAVIAHHEHVLIAMSAVVVGVVRIGVVRSIWLMIARVRVGIVVV